MKHFALGLAIGSAAGVVLSMISGKNGKRLGSTFKQNVEDTATDLNQLQDGLQKATNAKLALNEELPAARRAISDISDDLTKYQIHTQYRRNEMKKQAKKVKNNPLARKMIGEFEDYLEEEYQEAQKNKDKKD